MAVKLDVVIVENPAVDVPARIAGTLRNVYPLADSEAGLQLVLIAPDTAGKDKPLKDPQKLGFKDRVPAFLQWALLRLQRAHDAVPVRLTLLASEEPDIAVQINRWDVRYGLADAIVRAEMESDLRRRLRELVAVLRRGRECLSHFYPAAGWAAVAKSQGKAGRRDQQNQGEVDASALAKAVGEVWVKAHGDAPGERDYTPGYTRLLEGDFRFGDPATDPDARGLRELLVEAQWIDRLILLDENLSGAALAAPARGVEDPA